MLALGAVIMLCAVAIIGAGYAAFSNSATARTYNADNSATAGYMTITPTAGGTSVWDPMSTDNVNGNFSTYVYGHVTGTAPDTTVTTEKAYYFTSGATTVNSLTALKLGDTKTFTITNQTGANITSLSLNVKAALGTSGAVGTNTEFKYFLKIGDSTFIDINEELVSAGATETLTISINDGASAALAVELYIGYTADVGIPEGYIGDVGDVGSGVKDANNAADANAPADMKNVSFAFAISLPA